MKKFILFTLFIVGCNRNYKFKPEHLSHSYKYNEIYLVHEGFYKGQLIQLTAFQNDTITANIVRFLPNLPYPVVVERKVTLHCETKMTKKK